ncbi:obscurin-like isoform X8 [Amphibalanus amphitrite]|uniref:obscurin-like isoform X8 n=1 Tax=Amphibalanus amphitrite TaxID=1232801 RepID=UPI001C904346|nr:obscurin-like isoform X8 [Amphibalanus amphitrite]
MDPAGSWRGAGGPGGGGAGGGGGDHSASEMSRSGRRRFSRDWVRRNRHDSAEETSIDYSLTEDDNSVRVLLKCMGFHVDEELTEEERKERREQHLPHFVIRLKDTEILERASVVFMVKAEGQPEPTIEFFKDDVPLAQDDRVSLTRETSGAYELQIHHVRKQDAGVYKCVATNKKGQEECHGNITVTDDDTAVFSLLDKQKEIQDAENTNFTWFKDGEEFDPAERFKVLFKDEEDTLALVFQHVSPDDAGMYTCVAATESGRISCSAELTVQGGVKQLPMEPEAPSVVEGLQKTEVSAGGSAMLECKLRGYPAVNVTWTLNGEEIKPGGRFRMLFEDSETVALIIKNVTEADAGKIQVTARNELGACTSEADLVIKGPPKFRKKIQDMAIMIDETVRIEVDIDGTPKPEVKWYKDGQKLTETDRLRLVEESDTKYVLLIDRMELTDAGSYSIVASNTMGQMSDFWKVTAQAPPKFTKQLLREVVKGEQESATLEVKIQGSPVPKVKWYKDGEEITVDGRHYSVENDGHIYTLTINGLTRTDSAKYTCKISNEFGQDETTCQLHVKCAPEIDSGLGDMDVHEGEPFTLEIEATGYPVPVVKWYIDDVEITEKQNLYKKEHDGKFFRLNVSTANSSIIGTYRCTMKNELGSCETSGFINVLKSPEFEEPLCDTGADENKPLTLKVKILAVPEPEVTWYRDGEPITAKSSEIQISRDGEYYSMTFSNVKEAHQGNYSVMAKNSQGENSSSMHLTVYTLPQILTKFTDLICYINENKILVIEGYGNPIPDPHWFMDGNEIHSSENYVIQQDKHKYRLIIPRVKYEDAGSYKLTLKNRMGEVTEQCKLIVKPLSDLKEPHFFTHLVDNVKMKGEETVMSVEIRGIPQPDVKWYKDGVELAPDVNIMMTRDVDTCVYTLKIRNTGDEDMGDYACVATNEHGEMREECRLEVLFKPEIAGLREVAVIPGESARFHATVKANPKCRLKWQHDGMDLRSTENLIIETNAENTETSLRIQTVGMRDGGVYSVVAENAHGETTSNGVLLLRTAIPAFKKRLLNTGARLGQKLLLEAVVAGLPVPDVQWFKDGKPLEVERVDEQTFRHQVEATTSPDYGEYRVVAMNCVGTTESSCTVTEEVLPPVIDARLPTFSKKEEGDTLVLEAKVDGSPPPEITWMKDGEPLELSDRVKIEQLDDGTVRLTVTDLRPEDAGRYRMKASNGNGDACTESAVTVDRVPRKPSFDQTLGDVTVTEGKPLKLEARVLGYPRPVLKWLKNGRPLHGTEHISITTTPQGTTLVEIEGATPEDAGTYSVMAVNDLGDATVEADVTVEPPHRKPLMQDAFRPVRAVEGCPARIEGRVSGHPPPTVTWYKDGKPLDANDRGKPYLLPDGTFGLAFDRCLPEDSGAYTAKISNSEGDAEAAAKMEVIGKQRPGEHCAPAFTSPLRDTEVAEGSTLVLTADVTGNPLPDVSWTRDGAPLPSDERVFTGFDGDKLTLTIRPARVKDVGRYQVSLSNALGQADSAADVKVKKTYQAPHFAQKIFDLQQMPKYDAKFMGRVIGIPRPEVQWFFNDTPIKPSSKYRIKRDADMFALYVIDCCPDDAGVYSCVATNADGTSKCSANLEVVDHIARRPKPEPPYFLKTIGDCEVYPGMQGKFTACVAGYPEPDFEWYRDDMRMFPSDRILMEADGSGLIRLILKNADEGDSGRYKLKIFNTHGEAACEAELSYDTFDGMSSTRNLKDQYGTLEQQLKSGIPMPLSERPIISRMTDRQLTLSWRPSPTAGQRIPVTYHVEMAEAPRGDWFTVRSGIRGCSVEIRNLEPHRDYKFRIKVENKLGVSEPSPHITTQRERLVPDPPESMHLRDGETFLPDMSSYFPRDFDMDKWTGGRAHAPTFLRQEKSDQYGVKNHPADLKWYIYGFPMPDVRFTFNGKDIEMGGRYSHSYTRSGELSLFVNKMLDRDTGVYEAIATNASGEARQRVSLHIAEHPRFSLHPEESTVMQRDQARFEARVTGVPYPEIRWYKDWLPLAPSDRIRIHWKEPDTCVLLVNGCVPRDNGLYSISATNVAGTTSASAMLHVEYDEAMYNYISYSPARSVRPRTKAFEDFYNVGDELGRGTQGITYHVVERDSGRNFAAKCMSGKGDHRQMMNNEMWIMNQLSDRQLTRLYDAYESPRQLILVQELCAGGEVLPALCQKTTYNEGDIACVIRQVLWGLQHMHGKHIAHLGLTPGDILYTRPGGDDIKLIDFSYSRHINPQRPERLDYGMPEFVAPEIVNNECVGLPADIWSVGVITYLLLSGTSPFRGENDRETLKKIQTGEMDYDLDAFAGVSEEAKDFITKLLVFSPEERLDVRAALRHPWLKFADHMPSSVKDVSTDRLKIYLEKFRDWYRNASCRTWFRRRPLSSAFTHPSCMVYPPDIEYTPPPSPEPSRRVKWQPPQLELDGIPQREYPETEIGWVQTESHYQQGPDTYLLQLRDTGLPARLREYMKVAAERSPSYARRGREDPIFDRTLPVVHERRRFTDIMDEEIDDERKTRISRYDAEARQHVPRRLRYELGTRADAVVEAETLLESKRQGQFPFFREKPRDTAIQHNQPCELSCMAVGEPRPIVQWFRNDIVISESKRIKIIEEDDGRSRLQLQPASDFDQGVYKVVARNSVGQTVTKCRLFMGSEPGLPEMPEPVEHSDTEVMLRWKIPQDSGHTPILAYGLQMKPTMDHEWQDVANNIDHEFFCVRGLKPETNYHFRLRALNKFGWGGYSVPSPTVRTRKLGWEKPVMVTKAEKYLQQMTETGREPENPEARVTLDYSAEETPVELTEGSPQQKYSFLAEISRGRFSLVAKCVEKDTDTVRAAKIIEAGEENRDLAAAEYRAIRSLRHERIAALYDAFKMGTQYVLILEKLQGLDILTYFQLRHEYNENMVATVVTQVLDGLQYLHWRGVAHLDLQPDNIVLTSCRRVDVKLVDFGSAQKVTKLGAQVHRSSLLEYTAPELLADEPAFPMTDVWSLGVITYLLLSGTSPFRGETDAETRQNILFVRFRFEYLYREITTEATRFLMQIFKRAPSKRPTCEECSEHRWLLSNDYMLKRRERAVFLGNRLREYSDRYHRQRLEQATQSPDLLAGFGMALSRSLSVETNAFTTF